LKKKGKKGVRNPQGQTHSSKRGFRPTREKKKKKRKEAVQNRLANPKRKKIPKKREGVFEAGGTGKGGKEGRRQSLHPDIISLSGREKGSGAMAHNSKRFVARGKGGGKNFSTKRGEKGESLPSEFNPQSAKPAAKKKGPAKIPDNQKGKRGGDHKKTPEGEAKIEQVDAKKKGGICSVACPSEKRGKRASGGRQMPCSVDARAKGRSPSGAHVQLLLEKEKEERGQHLITAQNRKSGIPP